MSDLTIEELEAKIKMVESDIGRLTGDGETGRKLEMLSQYKEYLEDEVKFLKNERRQDSQN
jgi:hypothetical protein